MSTNIRILRPAETNRQSGLGKSRTAELEAEGLFPPRIKISERAAGHIEHEVQAVLAARAVGKSEQEIRELVAQLVAARPRLLGELLCSLGIGQAEQ